MAGLASVTLFGTVLPLACLWSTERRSRASFQSKRQ